MISEFRKTGRAARSIPRPLGRGGRTQFDSIGNGQPVITSFKEKPKSKLVKALIIIDASTPKNNIAAKRAISLRDQGHERLHHDQLAGSSLLGEPQG